MSDTTNYDSWMKRDFIGYGPNPPNPNWPNKAKICVNFVLNHEGMSFGTRDCSA
jgi:hypothetical protein